MAAPPNPDDPAFQCVLRRHMSMGVPGVAVAARPIPAVAPEYVDTKRFVCYDMRNSTLESQSAFMCDLLKPNFCYDAVPEAWLEPRLKEGRLLSAEGDCTACGERLADCPTSGRLEHLLECTRRAGCCGMCGAVDYRMCAAAFCRAVDLVGNCVLEYEVRARLRALNI